MFNAVVRQISSWRCLKNNTREAAGSISREKRQRAGMCGIAFLWRGARLELRAVATSTEAREQW